MRGTSRSSCCRSQTTPVFLSTEKYLLASSPETPNMRGSPSGSTAVSLVMDEPAEEDRRLAEDKETPRLTDDKLIGAHP